MEFKKKTWFVLVKIVYHILVQELIPFITLSELQYNFQQPIVL